MVDLFQPQTPLWRHFSLVVPFRPIFIFNCTIDLNVFFKVVTKNWHFLRRSRLVIRWFSSIWKVLRLLIVLFTFLFWMLDQYETILNTTFHFFLLPVLQTMEWGCPLPGLYLTESLLSWFYSAVTALLRTVRETWQKANHLWLIDSERRAHALDFFLA